MPSEPSAIGGGGGERRAVARCRTGTAGLGVRCRTARRAPGHRQRRRCPRPDHPGTDPSRRRARRPGRARRSHHRRALPSRSRRSRSPPARCRPPTRARRPRGRPSARSPRRRSSAADRRRRVPPGPGSPVRCRRARCIRPCRRGHAASAVTMSPVSSCTRVSSGSGSSVVDSRSLTRSPGSTFFAWPGPDETIAEDDRALHVRCERARPQRSDAAQRPRSPDDACRKGPQHAEMVQRHHDARARDVEDRVDVEVVLRRLVFGEDGLVEHRARPEVLAGEHDVATQVVPRAQAVERDDAADAVRLRVVDATLRVRVDLDAGSQHAAPALRATSSGRTEWRQRPRPGRSAAASATRASRRRRCTRAPRRRRCTRRRSDRPRRRAHAATGGSRTRARGRS